MSVKILGKVKNGFIQHAAFCGFSEDDLMLFKNKYYSKREDYGIHTVEENSHNNDFMTDDFMLVRVGDVLLTKDAYKLYCKKPTTLTLEEWLESKGGLYDYICIRKPVQ